MEDWEIVEGDFGGSYTAIVEGLDLHECRARIKVWRGSTLLIDGKPDAGMEVTYHAGVDESRCIYHVLEGDIPLTAAGDDLTRYRVMVEFTKDGYKEHDLGFWWIVTPAPP